MPFLTLTRSPKEPAKSWRYRCSSIPTATQPMAVELTATSSDAGPHDPSRTGRRDHQAEKAAVAKPTAEATALPNLRPQT
jgi:hypothetical protein